jgi:hypothetical protein
MANDISKYLNMTRNVRFWAIEMGTNDAWGGSNSNVLTFKKNMQLIIDSCKANNIHPIIARIIGTDSSKAKWQVHPDFLKAIDSLTIKNNLILDRTFFPIFQNIHQNFLQMECTRRQQVVQACIDSGRKKWTVFTQ